MNSPLAAEGPSEFWGRRWNTAFHDLAFQFLFRPLRRTIGARPALLAGFVASGVIHDVVISLPAGSGFGLPTAYFAIQAVGILLEKSHIGIWLGIGRGIGGRLFCFGVVLGPLGLLFHAPFVCGVMSPFFHAVGSIL